MIDDGSFAAFVRAHSRSLFGTAYLLTGDADAAEELLQDTLAALFPKWDQVLVADRPVAYVRRALANRLVSARRRPASRDVALWELPEAAALGDHADEIATRRMLWQLLGEVPPRQRAALVMRYFHDLSDAEIAASLGCRPATVRSLVSRGVATMRGRSAAPGLQETRGERS